MTLSAIMKGFLTRIPDQDELDWGKENCIQIKRIREVGTLWMKMHNDL